MLSASVPKLKRNKEDDTIKEEQAGQQLHDILGEQMKKNKQKDGKKDGKKL